VYKKDFPSEPVDTTAEDRCILVDGNFLCGLQKHLCFVGTCEED
jgi:hypothetical protein